MENNKLVSLVYGKGRAQNITESLRLIESDLDKLKKAKNILIKPNLVGLNTAGANTHVDAVDAVIKFIREKTNAKITIGESSATAFYRGLSTKVVYEKQGYYELSKKYKNVFLTDFDEDPGAIVVPIKSVVGDVNLRVSPRVNHFDYKISLSIPKTHNFAMVTCGIKNMAGLVKREDMACIHGMKGGVEIDAPKTLLDRLPTGTISKMRRKASWLVNLFMRIYPTYAKSVKLIHHNIANIAQHTWPDLVVLDGYQCMEGDGPVDGDLVDMDVAISSTDPLKADGIAVRVMGFVPEEIGYLYYLRNKGDYSTNSLVGKTRIGEVRRHFKRHRTFGVQRKWRT